MKNSLFWDNLNAYSTLMGLSRSHSDSVASMILWRAAHHILPGGIGGKSMVEYYYPETN